MNEITTWQQGKFIDGREYSGWSKEMKKQANKHESLLVRPFAKGNAICKCNDPAEAEWIAERLNLAAELEKRCAELEAQLGLDNETSTL